MRKRPTRVLWSCGVIFYYGHTWFLESLKEVLQNVGIQKFLTTLLRNCLTIFHQPSHNSRLITDLFNCLHDLQIAHLQIFSWDNIQNEVQKHYMTAQQNFERQFIYPFEICKGDQWFFYAIQKIKKTGQYRIRENGRQFHKYF